MDLTPTLFSEDDEIAIINIPDPSPLKLVRMYYAGKFILVKSKGYWYHLASEWGQLTRIKYAGQVRKLNSILEEVRNVHSD
jgi:hypothetical protein